MAAMRAGSGGGSVTWVRGVGRRIVPALVVLALAAGCGDSTGPTPPKPDDPVVPKPRVANPLALAEVIADVTGRMLPALPEIPERTAFGTALDQLVVALYAAGQDGNKVPEAQAAMVESRRLLAQLGVAVMEEPGYLVEVDAMAYALVVVSDAIPQ